jgi:hypothetical protein
MKAYLFDGEEAIETFNPNWVQISKIPTNISRKIPGGKKRSHWVLKEGFVESENLPPMIHDTCDITDEDHLYCNISGCYEQVIINHPESLEDIPFEISIVEEIKGEFKFVEQPFTVTYNLLDTLNTRPAMLQEKPCKLSSQDSYNIIRQHVKENINPKVAKISSDYDFCLTVEKVIPLAVPEAYNYNVNSGTKKKEKLETRYRNTRSVVVLKTAPRRQRDGVYQGYPETPGFQGESYSDMMDNIEKYLTKLIIEINRPYVECEHCQGRGVIWDEV